MWGGGEAAAETRVDIQLQKAGEGNLGEGKARVGRELESLQNVLSFRPAVRAAREAVTGNYVNSIIATQSRTPAGARPSSNQVLNEVALLEK